MKGNSMGIEKKAKGLYSKIFREKGDTKGTDTIYKIFGSKMRIPDYSDSISGSIRTIKPDTSGHLVMYFDFT